MYRKRIEKVKRVLFTGLLLPPALLVWWPLWFIGTGIFMPADELLATAGPAMGAADGYAVWHIAPTWPTLLPLLSLLLDTPQFFIMFWNSTWQTFAQLLGQLVVGVPAAWAVSAMRFRGRRVVRMVYLLLMLMPFAATMVPSYLVLRAFGLVDTAWAVILPGIFSAFPVFLMQKWFEQVPRAVVEAAGMDGAGPWATLWRIGIPLGMPGILAAMTLSFFEAWNAVEQPMVFLRNPAKWPLPLYLSDIAAADISTAVAAGFFTLLPAVLIFRFGQKYLYESIQMGEVKG